MDLFRVRLNCVDHYQAKPTSLDPPLFGKPGSTPQKDAPALPVIRVFGSTETGQKVCAHIHGALPYLFIEYRGSLDDSAVKSYIEQLRASIDRALATSYRRNPYDGKALYVGYISLVKGVPFFGYHVGYRHFLKVYMLNPLNMTRFADLLHQGAILGQFIQPFEAHAQYLAQWMCDFNLYGCAYIDCKNVKFRHPVPDYLEIESSQHKWHDRSIRSDWIQDATEFPRQSHCSIEVDICVRDILNRLEVEERNVHADFVERFKPQSPDEKLVRSLAVLWKDETRRRKRRKGITDPSSSPFPPEVLVSMSADPRDTKDGQWIHEQEFRQMIAELIEDEHSRSDGAQLSFEDFVQPQSGSARIQTALESVSDLFPERLRGDQVSFSFEYGLSPYQHGNSTDADQDAGRVDTRQFFDENEFPVDSDDETAMRQLSTQKDQPVPTLLPTHKDDEVRKPGEANQLDDRTAMREIDFFKAALARQKASSRARQDNENALTGRVPNDDDFFDEGFDESTVELPRKRRRLSAPAVGPAEELFFPTSFQQPPYHQHTEGHIPPSSQPSLSQSSIKAHGSQGKAGFKVAKPIQPSQDSHGKAATSSSEQEKIQTSERISSVSITPMSASGNVKSNAQSSGESSSPAYLHALAQELQHEAKGPATLVFRIAPPVPKGSESALIEDAKPPVIYQDAYYSVEKDVPDRARDYAGREFKMQSNTTPYLPSFDPLGQSPASYGIKQPILVDRSKEEVSFRRRRYRCKLRNWDYIAEPPTYDEVDAWLLASVQTQNSDIAHTKPMKKGTQQRREEASQIEGPTQRKGGFKYSQRQKSTSVEFETQYMSIMSLEVHVNTRANFVPDPEHDEIACVFWSVKGDIEGFDGEADKKRVGALLLSEHDSFAQNIRTESGAIVEREETELDLINKMVDIVRNLDPDILTGFEVHNGSWGYLIERARLKYEYNLCDEFSRMKSQSHGRFGKEADRWGFNHTSTIRVTGRHMINIWRAMRSELNLLQYTMENVVFHLLHKRIPHYQFSDLTAWYQSGKARDLAKVVNYFATRVQLNLDILDANELVPRTSEQARLIGVDFFSVFSRGSQFKVESFMFRIAKPENFILVSPSRKQVGQQNALECLPLVMEPQSDFYNSPLLVLDFQSLYPSIMIAYNYCYSTCLGRITNWRGTNKMGFADFKRQPRLLELVKDYINIAPNGLMYVKPEMRKSLLAKMLSEILETRVMVKSGMKEDKGDRSLQQLLNNRQLALKLLANVTYGYTSASFSGRMPCSEIADSIVQTARETLEKSIALIHSMEQWGAEVVYGDTDSLFIYLKGRSKEEAFRIGNEISKEITKRNPRPIKLKFEKVYFPCVLLAKKRYVGFKYESPDQKEPEFDAKGIETVRRDGTPAEQKIEEKALKILFRTADLSQVKSYFQRQCTKIMLGRVSVQDFCFAREVKLGTYADKGPPPPGALISTKRMLEDPRTEPQYGERVPYVVITGAPGARLIDRCVAPEQLLKREDSQLDSEYYISKNLIPPLERIFNLVGANVRQWYDEMPKVRRIREYSAAPTEPKYAPNGQLMIHKRTLESYMKSSMCLVCRTRILPDPRDKSKQQQIPLCSDCLLDIPGSLFTLRSRLGVGEQKRNDLELACRSCASLAPGEEVKCDSKDCPTFYSRIRARARVRQMKATLEPTCDELERIGLMDW